jgi:hypothetical protein
MSEILKKLQMGGYVNKPVINSVQQSTKVVPMKLITPHVDMNSDVMRKYTSLEHNVSRISALKKQLLKYGNSPMQLEKMYNPEWKGTNDEEDRIIKINKDLNDPRQMEQAMLQELGHSVQYDRGMIPMLATRIKDKYLELTTPVTDANILTGRPAKYDTPGRFEYEAHTIIGKKIMDDFNEEASQATFFESRPELKKKMGKLTALEKISNRKYQEGGFIEAKNWTSSYLKSPMFKERQMKMNNTELKLTGTPQPSVDSIVNTRLNNINNIKPTYVTGSIGGNPNVKGELDTMDNLLRVRSDMGDTSTIAAHELSHATTRGTPYSQSFNYNYPSKALIKPGGSTMTNRYDPYVQSPTEVKARLDSIRFQMNKKGLYDARTQEFDDAALKKLQNDKEITSSDDFKSLEGQLPFDRKGQSLKWLMNNIAQNKQQTEVQYAQQGGLIKTKDSQQTGIPKLKEKNLKEVLEEHDRAGRNGIYKFSTQEINDIEKESKWVNNWYSKRKLFNQPLTSSSTSMRIPERPVSYTKIDMKARFNNEDVSGEYNPFGKNPDEILLNKDGYPKTVALHEYNHYVQSENEFDKGYEHIVDNPIKQVIGNTYKGMPNKAYLEAPNEVQSRLMQFRYLNNLKPDQRIEYLDKRPMKLPEGSEDFFNKLSDQQLKDLLNKVVVNKSTKINYAQEGGSLYVAPPKMLTKSSFQK